MSDIQTQIKETVEGSDVVLYMKGTAQFPQCGFSAAVVQVLSEYKVPFTDVNILADQEKWAALKTFSDWPTMPQIYISGEFIGGCDIVTEMFQSGELEPLIKEAAETAES